MKSISIPRKWKSINLNTTNKTSIPTNQEYIFDISDHYEAYDYLRIVNLSSEDLLIILNGSQVHTLENNNSLELTQKFISISIKNIGTSEIEAEQIKINYGYNSTKEEFINKSLSVGRLIF